MTNYQEKAFSTYHPIVSFSYFVIMIVATMLFFHPIFIAISLITSVIYATIIDEEKAIKIFGFGVVTAISIAIVNVLFVHRGATILFYIQNNPVTFESLMYGICSGAMILSVILWFSAYNDIITTDKFLYIFGKIVPSIALMISMTIRLIPKLIHQTKIITISQKTVGLDCFTGSWINRAKSSMRVLSILVTWALEDSIQTADSMKARGYGLKCRTNFSIFTFTRRDMIMITIIFIVTILLVIGYIGGFSSLRFYPTIDKMSFHWQSICIYSSYLMLGILPSILELLEDRKWKLLK